MNQQYTITLIRHGETYLNSKNAYVGVTNDPLNPRGREQAETLSKYLIENDFHFDLILSSPLDRAYDTAEVYCNKNNKEIIKEPLLKERNYGIFEAMPKSEVNTLYSYIHKQYNKDKAFFQIPNGESAFEVESRIYYLFWKKVKEHYGDKKSILAFTHLNPIRAILRLTKLEKWDVYYKPFKNTSITQIETDLKSSKLILEDFSCVQDAYCSNEFK